jgi:hypothetical protein
MQWLTKKQIAEAAKTRAGAIKCSAKHWWQIGTCTKEEYEKVDNYIITTKYCALCFHYIEVGCKFCPLITCWSGSRYFKIANIEAFMFNDDGKIDGRKFRKFQRVAREFSEFIGELK